VTEKEQSKCSVLESQIFLPIDASSNSKKNMKKIYTGVNGSPIEKQFSAYI
jgi:hypothetical protein